MTGPQLGKGGAEVSLPPKILLLATAALLVATMGVVASATFGAGDAAASCVDLDPSTFEAGVGTQRTSFTEQHAQETGTPEAFSQETSVFTQLADSRC
jgi:hypothetical protein